MGPKRLSGTIKFLAKLKALNRLILPDAFPLKKQFQETFSLKKADAFLPYLLPETCRLMTRMKGKLLAWVCGL